MKGKEKMKIENAINFMMYSYFNLTLEDVKENKIVLENLINKAYLDATQRGAYNTRLTKKCTEKDTKKCPNKDSDRCIKNKSMAAKELATKVIKDNIWVLLKDTEGISKDNFENWHKTICDELCEIYADKLDDKYNEIFSYGNAQKWVNMTLKYICILYNSHEIFCENSGGNCDFCNSYGKMLENYEEYFHIPVDSYIIEDIYNRNKKDKEGKDIKLPEKIVENNEKKKYGLDKYISWSKWEDRQYIDFQDSLKNAISFKDGYSPLDWENEEWINVSKSRKEREEERKRKIN